MAEEYDDTIEGILKAKGEYSNCYQCDSAIFDLDLPSVEKLTFIALTRYFTSAGSTMPSNEVLAKDVGCSEERIALAIERLKEHVEFVPGPVIIKRKLQQ